MKITKAFEDYCEAILILEKNNQPIQSVQVAELLHVSKPAVAKIMNEMAAEGYIEKTNYSKITLTQEGRKLAEETFKKHLLLKQFLLNIGVSEKIAEHDCCLIEHIISDETIEKIKEFNNKK